MEWFAVGIARLLYRVRCSGEDHVPASGGAVIIANHLSYVDVVVLQLACPRPVRFVGFKGLREHRFFDWAFRVARAIPVDAQNPGAGLREAVHAAKAGVAAKAMQASGAKAAARTKREKMRFMTAG